ncbi:MAG TPA: MBL fold metallo-hydrolase [Firmicutes bacterium]|nr:MBL fold metallo-hydrolase [Bacillota bacterium]
MKIYPLTLGPVQTATYIVSENNKALVVDPADSAQSIIKYLKTNQLQLEAILLTHGHFDHIGAVNELTNQFNVPVYAHKKEQEYFEKPQVNLSTMMHAPFTLNESIQYQFLNDGEVFDVIGLPFKAFHVPGHTSGSLCYYEATKGVVFTGDTLFNGAIGRTDFIYGDHAQLVKGIKTKLLTLPADTIVYPGHGDCSTVEYEANHNMFLK